MKDTPAYKYISEYLTNTFPSQPDVWIAEQAERWIGLLRTVKFQKWVEEQVAIINKQDGE